jgi:uncharacterized protein DUF6259
MNIYKSVKNKNIDFEIFHKCWEVAIIDGKNTKTLPVSEFEFQILSHISGKFTHKELPLDVFLTWSTINDWAANCNISFKTDQSVRVMSITFKTPERVSLDNAEEKDYLMYPFKTGIKIPTPTQTLFNEFKRKDTRYGPGKKTRHLNVIQSGLPPITDAQIDTNEEVINELLIDFTQKIVSNKAEWGREQSYSYPGGISMTWMDYCGPDGGIYFAAHDKNLEKAQLFFAAERGQQGITLGIDKILNRHLSEWNCDFVVGYHKNDWHQGAELYRQYMTSVLPATVDVPDFFKNSPGFITHYDFKWEEGTITHRYADLPKLYKEAANHGFDTLLLGGWNNGGFDNYTLNYANDPDLGSETELKNAVKEVHNSGGKVLFYVNALSISMDNKSYTDQGEQYAIRKQNGKIDCFGEFFLEHPMATLCNSVKAWREDIKRNIKYVLLELNADGVYLDQIGSAPRECYDENHNHNTQWASNYRILLTEIRQELKELGKEDYVFLTEYPMDLYKDLIDSFLCYSFWQSANELCCPAMFRYAFPEVQLIDMVLQKPWLGRLSSLENQFAQETFCRQFINGLKYWTYCHAPENEQLKPFFDSAIKLHKYAVEYFSNGEYLDDINILNKTPGILIKEFVIKGKGRLLAIWNPTGKKASFFLPSPITGITARRDLKTPDQITKLKPIGNKLELSESLLAIIFIP